MGLGVKSYNDVSEFIHIEIIARAVKGCLISEIDLISSKGTGLPN